MRMRWRVVLGCVAVTSVGCGDDSARQSNDWAWWSQAYRAAPDASTGDADAGSEWSPREADARTLDDASVPAPFTHELAGLVSQPVRWASVDVTITGARVMRGLDTDVVPSWSTYGTFKSTLDPSKIYAELDLSITEKGSTETDYTDRSTWDLKLREGTRLQSVDALGVSILPGDTVHTQLHYELDAATSLAGATLILNGDSRGELEPEEVPLDESKPQEYPRRIATLVGKESAIAEEYTGAASLRIDEAVLDINVARSGRAVRGRRCVWLRAAVTAAADDWYVGGVRGLRLVIDGRASAPSEYEHSSVLEGTTETFFVAFEIAEAVTAFELFVPDGTAAGRRFPVNLTKDAVYADDVP
jgi:hypothetical protein